MASLHGGGGVVAKPPAGLAGVLNPEDHRDSAYYSAKDPASKHNSTQSNGSHSIEHLLTSRTDASSGTDLTPSPISNGPNTQPLNSPASGAMSVASIVSPTTTTTTHSFSQGYYSDYGPNADSRRESVDSRLGTNFGNMQLAGSPYTSANPSTTSLQNTLAQQRNPGSAPPDRNSGPFRYSNGYQPTFQRGPELASMSSSSSRTAPLITGPALGAIARAPEPTKGQAWAFPEEEVQRIPSGTRPSEDMSSSRHGPSFYENSRRNSYAESVASSQYTAESRLPPGQRRLDDETPSEFNRGSSEYMSTHHHSLQNRTVGDLQNDDGSPTSSQPYSRTPELRVSHKLAERKRRLEMKDLFDNLRILQSVERGAKASKWEILSKAISEHERQTKVIEDQKKQIHRLEGRLSRHDHDVDQARQQAEVLRAENQQLRAEIDRIQGANGSYRASNPPPPPHPHGYNNLQAAEQAHLPPLRNMAGPEVMNGVQYQYDQRNGYRTSDRH